MPGPAQLLLTVGVLVELFGIALTAAGLRQTWRQNAAGVTFAAQLHRELRELATAAWSWVKVTILRRPRRAVVAHGTAWGTLRTSGSAVGHLKLGLDREAPVEQQIIQLKQELDEVSLRAAHAEAAAESAQREIERVGESTAEQLTDLRESMSSRITEVTIDGLPTAVLGLLMAAVGTGLQWGSSVTPRGW